MLNPALLSAALLAFAVNGAAGLAIPWRNTKMTTATGTLLLDACKGAAQDQTVCYPYNSRKYIHCHSNGLPGTAKKCNKGDLYDYGLRTCVKTSNANPCPAWPCPFWGGVYGTQGVSDLLAPATGIAAGPHNYTINMTTQGSTMYFDPVNGRCELGLWLNVKVLGKPPPGWVSRTYSVSWEGPMNNGMLIPKKLDDVVGFIGDTVILSWSGAGDYTYVGVASFNPMAADAAPVTPYLPQPNHACPVWTAIRDDPQVGRVIPELGNETRLVGVFSRPPNSTSILSTPLLITINATMHGAFFANPSPPACRQGMVFKVKIVQEVRAPKIFNITWEMDKYDNFPDMELIPGDTLSFIWATPHGPPTPLRAEGVAIFPLIQASGITLLPAEYGASANTWLMQKPCNKAV